MESAGTVGGAGADGWHDDDAAGRSIARLTDPLPVSGPGSIWKNVVALTTWIVENSSESPLIQ